METSTPRGSTILRNWGGVFPFFYTPYSLVIRATVYGGRDQGHEILKSYDNARPGARLSDDDLLTDAYVELCCLGAFSR